jgi:hypothetical protein
MRRKTAKHHRVDSTNAHTGQHGKGCLGDHGHVNQHPVALAHAQAFQNGRHALHLDAQLGKAVGDLGIRFGGDINERGFVGVLGQMAVHRVVAQIGLPPKYQLAKGGSA